MKTTLQNPYLNQLLPQLIKNHKVVQLFHTPQINCENTRLIIHLQSKNEAGTLQNQKWVSKLHKHHNTFVHFFYSTQLHHHYKIGNPFIMAYCKPSAIIYANNDLENHLLLNPADKKKHIKKYKAYKQQFHHDHDLLKSQIPPLVTADCAAAVLLQYENLLNHDLDYLESLYTGTPNNHQTLNERIISLTQYAPQIQKHFVKKTGNTFHLIDLIEKAKDASLEAEWFFGSEHYKAFDIAEQGVFEMVKTRFKMIKKITKQTHPREGGDLVNQLSPLNKINLINTLNTTSLRAPTQLGRSNLVNLVTTIIQKTNPPEEIYHFHQTHPRASSSETSEAVKGDGNTQTHYLLLIGNNFSNQLLKNLTTKLNAQTGSKAEFVLIAHTRSWIQEWLYAQQDFFKKIIQEENRIFTTSAYHPKPHWEHPYTPDYPDLDFYQSQTVHVFDQFLLMADRQTDNYSGVANLFSLFFQTFCKTYLFATISYYPNNLHSKALWQLCLYANPELKRYEYLFQELETPFFNFVDKYRTIQLTYPFNQKQKTHILIDIADKLVIELKNKLPRYQ